MSIFDRFSLKGKVAVVTGGAGLYGRQIVRALAEAGAETYSAARNLQALEQHAAAQRADGLNVKALAFDLADERSILQLRDTIVQRSGRIDVLVNNALRKPMPGGFTGDASGFSESLQVNATGLFIISRAFGDVMASGGCGGSIINVASIHGMVAPDPTLYEGTGMEGYNPDYYFHKAGMINLTRFLASYYGPKGGIRCNSIAPGGYGENAPLRHIDRYKAKTCLGRRANDTDLMGVIVFLASDASLYVTGVNIPIDGGYTIM